MSSSLCLQLFPSVSNDINVVLHTEKNFYIRGFGICKINWFEVLVQYAVCVVILCDQLSM